MAMAMSLQVAVLIGLALIGCSSGQQYGCRNETSLEGKINTICREKHDHEKQQQIDAVLKNNNWKKLNFAPYSRLPNSSADDDLNCKTIAQEETPYTITTHEYSKSTTHVIVQSPLFQQTIKIIKCKSPGETCFENLIHEGSAECAEKWGHVSLYVFDDATKKIKYHAFERPVCCYCRITRESD